MLFYKPDDLEETRFWQPAEQGPIGQGVLNVRET